MPNLYFCRMKVHYLFLAFIFLGVSCGRKQHDTSFTIQGKFSSSKGEKIVLYELDVDRIIALDSAKLDNDGQISFSHYLDQPGFYLLMLPDGRRIILVMKKGEDLLLKGNLKQPITDFTISGSAESQLLADFFQATAKNKVRIDSIKSLLLKHEGSDDFLRFSMVADSLFSRITDDQKMLEKDFIDQHLNALASLIVLNYSFGTEPVLSMKDDLIYYQKLTSLYSYYPKNKHVLFHLARLNLYVHNIKKR